MSVTAEHIRLEEDRKREKNWKRWGPYLSERQWGTVREDYSPDGSCWDYFPHDHARSRAYRWGEDGLLGITDRECRLCFAVGLWNGRDPILKERLFGLTGSEGNQGEDCKECYYYLDSLPTHSYMKALYKYPQAEFPYAALVREGRLRKRGEGEFELADTGIFDESRYFDVTAEYAKGGPNDILIRLTAINRGPESAKLHVVPTLWYRNSWSWGRTGEGYTEKPTMTKEAPDRVACLHPSLGRFHYTIDTERSPADLLFTENETNMRRLFDSENGVPHVKDAFHEAICNGEETAASRSGPGTKACFVRQLDLPPGGEATIDLRLFSEEEKPAEIFGASFSKLMSERKRESDEYYASVIPANLGKDERNVMRQSYAGLLWTKQFYWYSVREWRDGDPLQPAPADSRKASRNVDWDHLYNRDIISMPDKWEYPWYAAWDLAFHMLPFCRVDSHFAKQQLILLLREWYMHPNGQIPAYEFAFSDVNPPVHAWACWRIYKITARKEERDRTFLARVFQKLLLNFTWWVNRKDIRGRNLFAGGFLGLDNIGVFDRSSPLPEGSFLEQADGTAWMAFYCLTMLSISLELAAHDRAYGDVASKFFEHFVAITDAINTLGGTGLWDQLDGFYYDQLHLNGTPIPLRVRSIVGIIPMLAVEVLEQGAIEKSRGFQKRMSWFLNQRKDLARYTSYLETSSEHGHRLLAVPSRERLERMLRYILDENEFLSPFGIRSLSKIHSSYPYTFKLGDRDYRISYDPGESTTQFFGGNSNWRGPVWFPLNYLLIEALERYHYFYGDTFMVECPTGSGQRMNLKQVSMELSRRLCSIFLPDGKGIRPCHHDDPRYAGDPAWKDLVLFYEYFHGDNGRGVGASHQTGWTALITRCFEKLARENHRA